MFLKIVHYALFGASTSVRDYMFANGVDRDTVHLNDVKFFKAIIYILVSLLILNIISDKISKRTITYNFLFLQVNLFGYKSKITQDQFFKYGYAEMKMLLCCDIISLVKRK